MHGSPSDSMSSRSGAYEDNTQVCERQSKLSEVTNGPETKVEPEEPSKKILYVTIDSCCRSSQELDRIECIEIAKG